MPTLQPFLLFLLSISFFLITTTNGASPNPFTAKAALIRYWDRKTPNQRPHPPFFLSKLSPLSALDSTTYSSLLSSNPSSLTPHLLTFCSAAHLLCSPWTPSLTSKSPKNSHFANYNNVNFTNYGSHINGNQDSFKNYSQSQIIPVDVFKSYSRDSVFHDENFKTYSPNGTITTDNFTSYASSAVGGAGDFTSYGTSTQVSQVNFANYETESNGHTQNFTSYSDANAQGFQTFTQYAKRTNAISTIFTSYSKDDSIGISTFKGYGEGANNPLDEFKKYGTDPGLSHQNFKSYGDHATAGTQSFSNYRGKLDDGDSTFASYGKVGNNPTLEFSAYGKEKGEGNDHFTSYGEGATDPKASFKSYKGTPTEFKSYSKTGVTFADYQNSTVQTDNLQSGKTMNIGVEPGKFFRESSLKEGTVMPMPDIRDKMPKRSFLPRDISGQLPFNAIELAKIFDAPSGTALGRAISDTISECERAPSAGETKRCATSAEDMIDFAVSVLGSDAVPRSTESAHGSGSNILIGKVKGIDGGRVTKSVSCHQSLFPYLVYYCHSVPKVRVYEAEILSVETKEKINHGVAICHLDTSDWSPGHGAFVALGSKPGVIEVCHWIFEGDLTWGKAD
ncbi:polygalacturonase 1 beta-like protein 3 [Dioscorea cayenensis subsp. rotundata]|uniref:Polygalacturonase 1 beta-like protein 3 n=1 Tax=Dioscorea cayennensis subsp. rotundata TaxID=55577 RepID=A0AB40CDA8_DIOCR|nr:polygalacturonase 1 beta-like protein 3 [Dioscorea cayenensis subsp. rotundata]